MQEQHRTHIVSTWSTVGQRLEEVRQVITRGRTPGGTAVAPLPEAVQEELTAALDRFEAQLREFVRQHAPSDAPPGETAADWGAARMWVSVLLRTIQELVEDLLPRRMGRRYGTLPPERAKDVEQSVEAMLDSLRQAIAACDKIGEDRRGRESSK